MWQNKKFKTLFKGSYSWVGGERLFILGNGKRNISFESHQMAKKLGWIKL